MDSQFDNNSLISFWENRLEGSKFGNKGTNYESIQVIEVRVAQTGVVAMSPEESGQELTEDAQVRINRTQ